MSEAWDRIVGDEPEEERLWELFHENSKTHRLSGVSADEEVAAAMLELWEDLPYPGAETVPLAGLDLPPVPLADAILSRRTDTAFGTAPISLAGLSSLLAGGYGATARPSAVGGRRFRTVPSAGALYPLELYVRARAVVGLEPGLYHFQAAAGVLQRLPAADGDLAHAFVQQDAVEAAAAVILITAVFARTTFKYGERGYRFALIEAGHVAQNVDLVACALGLAAANLGGFFDRELEALLELDGVEHSLLYAVAVGSHG